MQKNSIIDATHRGGQEQTLADFLAMTQAVYFLATGIWPQIGLRSFEKITGPKVDKWLVRSVGIQVGVVGATIALAIKRRRVTPEVEFLAAASALGLAAIDIVYAGRRRIRAIYLLDAIVELGFAAGWLVSRQSRSMKMQTNDCHSSA
jgi:hypothetical protein